jgi:hypothetical protein
MASAQGVALGLVLGTGLDGVASWLRPGAEPQQPPNLHDNVGPHDDWLAPPTHPINVPSMSLLRLSGR